jgi:hypothetical protein
MQRASVLSQRQRGLACASALGLRRPTRRTAHPHHEEREREHPPVTGLDRNRNCFALAAAKPIALGSPVGGAHSTGGVGKGDGGEEKQRRAKKSANAAFGGQ